MDGLRVLWSLAAAAAVIYLTLFGLLFLFQRSLIFHPNALRSEPAASGVPEMAAVELATEDGLALTAWWRAPPQPTAPVLLYLHGNAGTLAHRAPKIRPYLDRGWGVLLVTWRGYGGNPGRPSEQGLYRDGRAALAFLDRQGIAPRRLALYGESLGTGVAVQLAIECPPGVLVLEAPFTSMVDAGAAHYPIFPAWLIVRDRFDSVAKIHSVRAPLLLMHGARDRVVPIRLGRRLFDAAPVPKQAFYVPEAAHTDLYDFGAADAVIGFVGRYLRQAVGSIK
jgi:fermentation-respiration switch protein FrsA (DUF1100 family)